MKMRIGKKSLAKASLALIGLSVLIVFIAKFAVPILAQQMQILSIGQPIGIDERINVSYIPADTTTSTSSTTSTTAPTTTSITATTTTTAITPQAEVDFDRSLDCHKCGQHKAPPLTDVNVIITATVSSTIENAVLVDYFPVDWTVIDANSGSVSSYDAQHNKIEWSVGTVESQVEKSYIIRSPQRTTPSTKYYFQTEITDQSTNWESDLWMVVVADPVEPNPMGIEYNPTSSVWHIWNELDDYYVNASSGIQISNHYEEYWTKNVFCVWINTGAQWVRRCSDTFNWGCPACGWVNTTDNETFVELNGTTYYEEGSYSAYLKVRYYLHSGSQEMNITLGARNTGTGISDSYFGWITKDIKIDNTEANDLVRLNLTGEPFELNLSEPLAVEYTDLQGRGFKIRDSASVNFRWDDYGWKNDVKHNTSYRLNITHSLFPNQYNTPIGLLIHIGTLDNQDTAYTNFWWSDPAPSDCVHCVWIATGEDIVYRVESNDLTTDLESWPNPDRSASAFSVDYMDGFVYYTDYADDELVNMSLSGAEQNFWDISGFTSDVYGLCNNETHFFMPGKTDDVMHITTIANPAAEVDTFSIYADTEGCFYHPDDNTIYIVYAADYVANYSVEGAEQTGPWELHGDMSGPTGIIWNSTHWLISDDSADEIFVLTTANLIGNTYSENIDAAGADLQGLAYYYNDLFPTYSDMSINITEVFTGDAINHSVALADMAGLSKAVFSWNASGTSCDTWENATWQSLSGTSDTSYNITTIPTACIGKDVGYKFYFNDTGDQWNTTGIENYTVYKYGNIAVNWTYGAGAGINDSTCTQGSPCNVDRYNTFTANATVECVGGTGATCGDVSGAIRYNSSGSSVDALIDTAESATPMFVVNEFNKTYDYWGITQSNSADLGNATSDSAASCFAFDEWGSGSEISDSNYKEVNRTDSLYFTTSGGLEVFACQYYNLKVGEASSEINALTIYYDGYTADSNSDGQLNVWNYTLGDWQNLATFISGVTTATFDSGISDLIDSTQYIHLGLSGAYGGEAPGGGYDLNTDYIKVNVTFKGKYDFGSMSDGDQYQLNYTVNLTEGGDYAIDFNFTSSYSSITENDTNDAYIHLPYLRYLNASWIYGAGAGINETTCTQASPCTVERYDTFNANATVKCISVNLSAGCGRVTGNINYNISSSIPDMPVEETKAALQMFIEGGSAWYNASVNAVGGQLTKRSSHSMAYDSSANRTILFGGNVGSRVNDTWIYNYSDNTWYNAGANAIGGNLTKRFSHVMTYDSSVNRTILFGGDTSYGRVNDTWMYNYSDNTWYNATSANAVVGGKLVERSMSALTYDSGANRTILFGGFDDGSNKLSDTWIYNYSDNTWYNAGANVIGGSLVGRYAHSMAYDPTANRTILFGGFSGTGFLGDTWIYNYSDNTWYNASANVIGGSLVGRSGSSMVYDSDVNRTILFGGYTSGGRVNDTWIYNYNDNTWYNASAGTVDGDMVGRNLGAAAYDSVANRTILFGGTTDSRLNDTWILDASIEPRNSYSFGAMSDNDQRQINYTINLTEGGTYAIDFNFSSSYGSSVVPENTTNDAYIYSPFQKYLNISWVYGAIAGINETTCTQSTPCEYSQNNIFKANVTVHCIIVNRSDTHCGYVNESIRYNKTSSDPDDQIDVGVGATPMFIQEGPVSTSRAYWRPVYWVDIAFGIPYNIVDLQYNDTSTGRFLGDAGHANYTYVLIDPLNSSVLFVTAQGGNADTFVSIYNWSTSSWYDWWHGPFSPTTNSARVNQSSGLVNSTGAVIVKLNETSSGYPTYYDTYMENTGITYDYSGITQSNSKELMNATSGDNCESAWGCGGFEFADTFYGYISLSNGFTTYYNDQANYFNIKINESVSNIESLVIRWEGDAAGIDVEELWIWNSTEYSELTFISMHNIMAGVELYYQKLDTSISNYIDSDGYVHLKVNITQNDPQPASNTNYIKVNVIKELEIDNPYTLYIINNDTQHQINYTVNVSTATEQHNLVDFSFVSSLSALGENSTDNAYLYLNPSAAPSGDLTIKNITQTITISSQVSRQTSQIRTETQTLTTSPLTAALQDLIRLLTQVLDVSELYERIGSAIRGLSQVLDMSTAVARIRTFMNTISQSLSIAEAVSRIASILRSLSQSFTANAIVKAVADISRTISQTLSVQNVAQAVKGVIRAISQTLNISNVVSRLTDVFRVLTQSLNVNSIVRRVLSITKMLSQSLSLNDVVTRVITIPRTIIQNLSMNSIVAKISGTLRSVAQSLSVSNISARVASIIRTLTQSLNATNIVSRLASIFRTLTESLTANNIVIRLGEFTRALTQGLTTNAVTERIRSVLRALIQSLATNNVVARLLSGIRRITEQIGLTNITQRVVSINRVLSEALSVNEVAAKISGILRSVAQTLNISNISTRVASIIRALTQSMQIITQAEKIAIGISERVVTLAMTITDSVARTVSAIRSLTQSFVANMSVQRILTRIKNISQVLTTNTVVTRIGSILRVLTQSLNATNIASRLASVFRALTQITSILSQVTRTTLRSYEKVVSVVVSITDNILRSFSAARSIVQSVASSLNVQRMFVGIRTILQTLTSNTTVAKFRSVLRSLSQTLSATATAIRTSIVSRLLTQTLDLTNITSALSSLSRTLSQAVNLTSAIERLRLVGRALSQVLDLADVVDRLLSVPRTITQSLSINTLVSRLRSISRILSQSVGISNISERLVSIFRTLTQSLSIANISERLGLVSRILNQALNLTSITKTLSGFARALSQSLNINTITTRLASISKMLSQSLSATAMTERIASFSRLLEQTFSITQTTERLRAIGRILTQTINANVLVQRLTSIWRTITKQLTVSALTERIMVGVYDRIVSLYFGIYESVGRTIDIARTLVQTLNVSNIINKAYSTIRSLSQSITTNAITTRLYSAIRSMTQLISSSTISKIISAFSRALTHIIDLTSVVERIRTVGRTLVQPIVSSLNVQRILSGFRTLTQSMQIIAQVEKISVGINERITTLAVTLTDNIIRSVSAVRVLLQTLTQNVIVSRISDILRNVTGQVTFTESLSRVATLIRSITQSLTIDTVVERISIFVRTLIESFNINNVVVRLRSAVRALTQSLNATNVVSRMVSIFRTLTESLTTNNVVTRFGEFTRALTQSLTTNVFTERISSILRALSQSFSATGMVTRVSSISRILTQALGVVDNVTKIAAQTYERIVSLYFAIAQAVQTSYVRVRLVSQAVGLDTITGRIAGFYRSIISMISFILRSIIPCSVYNSEPSCQAAGCYWYSSSCHEVPTTPTTTTTIAPTAPSPRLGLPIIQPPTVNVEFMKISILKEIQLGQVATQDITVKNKGDFNITDLNINIEGVLSEWTYVSPTAIDFDMGELESFSIAISVPLDALTGDYNVTIELSNENVHDEAFFILRVKPLVGVPSYLPVVTRVVEIDKIENETNVNIIVSNQMREFKQLELIENIPKELAESADIVDFKDTPTEIVQADPIVAWSLMDIAPYELRTLSYSVPKVLDEFTNYIYWQMYQLNIISEIMPEELGYVDLKMPMLYQDTTSALVLVLENREDVQHTYNVTFDLPEGWEIDPAVIEGIMEPNERKTFSLLLSVPKGAPPGIYMIKLLLAWDEDMIIREFSQEVKPIQLVTLYLILCTFASTIVIIFLLVRRRKKKRIRIKELVKIKREVRKDLKAIGKELVKEKVVRQKAIEEEIDAIDKLREDVEKDLRKDLKKKIKQIKKQISD